MIEVEELKFIEKEHKYLLNNRELPSVTQIISFITNTKYDTIPDSVLEQAQDKGTTIHFAAEVYNKTGYIGIDKEYEGFLNAYVKWINDYKIDRHKIQSELKTYNKTLNYAGTIDIVYDKKTIIDIKTTAELDLKSVAVQTSAYRIAVNQEKGYDVKDCYVLRLKKDGSYEYVKLQDKFNIFLSCLTLYNYVKGGI